MADTPTLKFYNTLAREKQVFEPIDAQNVRLYVCGPTVYDYAHIGNARPAIVFDVLFRLLRHVYGENHVNYVRNITDVDDKINARALRDFPNLKLNDAIRRVTEKTETQYVADVATLGCLNPTVQPRATENIDGMIAIVQSLLDSGHAYVAQGSEGREALFDVLSMKDYGRLSRRNLENQQAGARVAVESHKRNPEDFVLWKESAPTEPGWPAIFTISDENREALQLNQSEITIFGRPGWHIECSAMSDRFLWEEIKDKLSPKAKSRPHQFDIHGGGLDLIFPHHENEIAQSCCAFDTGVMANIWMHNGFLQVEGKKMSKSEGNFVTINELLETGKFGGRKWPGEVLRLAMLMTHYREPIDFSVKRLEEAEVIYRRIYFGYVTYQHSRDLAGEIRMGELLSDDLDTVAAVKELHRFARNTMGVKGISDEEAGEPNPPLAAKAAGRMISAAKFLGLLNEDVSEWVDEEKIKTVIIQRLEQIKAKNWAEADRIRDELLAKGIQLKDGKDPATGERITTWEVKR